jgi:hypothetical protein
MKHQVTVAEDSRCIDAGACPRIGFAAQAWIARYEAESARAASVVLAPQSIGSFGQNSNGLLDVGGNVWEWTETCFIRATLDDGPMRVTNSNCGVRVVQGAHRTYMTDFIRDPRARRLHGWRPPGPSRLPPGRRKLLSRIERDRLQFLEQPAQRLMLLSIQGTKRYCC